MMTDLNEELQKILNSPPLKVPKEWVVDKMFTIPDSIEPIVAWRSWNLNPAQDRLISCSGGNEIWEPGKPMVASCRHRNHRHHLYEFDVGSVLKDTDLEELTPDPSFYTLPVERCTCGIYAARTKEHAMSYGEIYGEVYLWGKVIPGEKAFRAQYAYPKRLYWMEPPTIVDFLALDPSMRAAVQSATDLLGHSAVKDCPWLTWGHKYTHSLECYGVEIVYDERT